MKKMLGMLALAVLPLVSYAGVGKEIILFPKTVRVLSSRTGGVVKTFTLTEAALKRAAKAAAMAAKTPKMLASHLPPEDGVKVTEGLAKLDEYTFYTQGYSNTFGQRVYSYNPYNPVWHSEYDNYSITWDVCQRYIERVSKRLNAQQLEISADEVKSLLQEGENVQASLRGMVATSMQVADEAMMEMDSALSAYHRFLAEMIGVSGEVLSLPQEPYAFAQALRERNDRGMSLLW